MKQQIVDIHNELRNQQASGKTPGYEQAARMGTIVRTIISFSQVCSCFNCNLNPYSNGTMNWRRQLTSTPPLASTGTTSAAMSVSRELRRHFRSRSCKLTILIRCSAGWNNVGQNIAMKYIAGHYLETEEVIDSQVRGWFSEFKNCDMKLIKQYNNNG